jgi:hypothetical protein
MLFIIALSILHCLLSYHRNNATILRFEVVHKLCFHRSHCSLSWKLLFLACWLLKEVSMLDNPAAVIGNQKQNVSSKTQPNDSDFRCSEPMRIQVTVYSLEGIRRHDAETRQSTTQNQSRIFQKRSIPKLTSTAPTTAIISLRGQVIKTLVPSAPLSFYEPRKAERSVRGIAYWQENSLNAEIRNKDNISPSTFELTRNMRRQCFHREARIDQVSQFLPERVDLVVGIARGKDIFPLGVASVVVNGEEEGESVMNIPIKSLVTQNEKMLSKKGRQKKGLLFDGDSYWYSLEFNAFLRVGICVIPRHNYIPKTMETMNKFNSTIEKSEDNMYIELNDENSLIAHFKDSEQTETMASIIDKRDEYKSGYNLTFCGALECWPGLARQPPSLSSDSKTMASKILEAKVLSLRAMSDVSGSTARWQMRQEQKYDV